MRILKFTLKLCAFAGCWQPLSWITLFQHVIYTSYRLFLFSILCTFNITQFMNAILNVDNSDELTDTLYMMLTVSVAFYKISIMWRYNKNVKAIVNNLMEKPFVPSDACEIEIRQKYDKTVKKTALWYSILVLVTVVAIILGSIFTEFVKGNLTYKAWLPFNYTRPTLFTVVYIHQLMGMSTTASVNVACDSLVCGILLHICCQFEILQYRLTKVTHGQDVLRDCVRHHGRIFEYAYIVNSEFAKIIATQFAVSMLVVCSNLYKLAMATINVNILPLILYTACMLAQIFIYCWFGNEVKLKSLQLAEGMYNMNWLTLNNSTKKSLLLIIKRAMVPIEFTCAVIITMNLDSFVAVLKMSYSVFNLLKRT